MVVLGLMSGTSLDGLDLALVRFSEGGKKYELLSALTLNYGKDWSSRLKNARKLSKNELKDLSLEYGNFIGHKLVLFLKGKEKPDLISSHGHTVFHQPEQGITLQIGDLNQIASVSGITTVGDFRSFDVSKGGQGAPLVPIGDEMLFSEYDYCVNLGGISNYSRVVNGERKAKDIAPCNIVSNLLSIKLGAEFDENGEFGRNGKIQKDLLNKLSQWPYYLSGKSLGIENLEDSFIPILDIYSCVVEDKLRTYYEHISQVIGSHLAGKTNKALFTGGGVKNSFLMNCIQKYSDCNIIIPADEVIEFKEAIIFGLLGYLRINNKINVLSSVTGASSDSSSGSIVYA
tara:strand:- start:13677 stop:14708 length:1032 start_codon:yes stop_codon:yes gene_type:complete